MGHEADVHVLRDLAERYAAVAADPVMDQRRDLWRRHNSFAGDRPLVLARWFACADEVIGDQLVCEDRLFRAHERQLRVHLFHAAIGDDVVLEPWLIQPAVRLAPAEGSWGVPVKRSGTTQAGGSWVWDPPIKTAADLERLVMPEHRIDEARTAELVDKIRGAVGDILPVTVDRGPRLISFAGDISTDLAYLRGLEQMMLDMAVAPEFLHRLVGFLADGVARCHDQAEAAGDWRAINTLNQSVPYALELPDPTASEAPRPRRELWGFMASQEFTAVSPAMQEEFLLRYQIPILAKFGQVAYGCCEDLSRKIGMLEQIPNLRRVAVTPSANIPVSAEALGDRYIVSWRPNPTDMGCVGFDPDHIRRVLREALATFAANGCRVDLCLKDVQTLEGEPDRLRRWAELCREVIGC